MEGEKERGHSPILTLIGLWGSIQHRVRGLLCQVLGRTMTPLLSEVLAREMEVSCDIELAMCEHDHGRIRDGQSKGCSAERFAPGGSVLACSKARDGEQKGWRTCRVT